jgi:hypothetical protein
MTPCSPSDILAIARIAGGLPGTVSPGTLAGAIATPRASARNTHAPTMRPGAGACGSRSAPISTAMTAIHQRLIAPSANREAIISHEELRQSMPASIRPVPAVWIGSSGGSAPVRAA